MSGGHLPRVNRVGVWSLTGFSSPSERAWRWLHERSGFPPGAVVVSASLSHELQSQVTTGRGVRGEGPAVAICWD